MSENVLAIDIGGTKVAVAIVTSEGQILAEDQTPTGAYHDDGTPRTGDEIYADVDAMLRRFLGGGSRPSADSPHPLTEPVEVPQRVGIGSAGPIELHPENPALGSISPLNVPGWREFPIVARVRETLASLGAEGRSPVLIGDGHCVALGEQWLGAGQGHDSIIGVICSTGVGGGVVTNGVPFQGRTGNAVHMGHISVQTDGRTCACGSRGCVEALASGTSMTAIARERGWQGADAKQLTEDAAAGDPIAIQVIDEGMKALASGLASCAVCFDVPVVVVGGGVSKAGETVFEPLRRYFHEYCRLGFVADEAKILQATLPNAGLLGAARAAMI